jgi:hypothetical protein
MMVGKGSWLIDYKICGIQLVLLPMVVGKGEVIDYKNMEHNW